MRNASRSPALLLAVLSAGCSASSGGSTSDAGADAAKDSEPRDSSAEDGGRSPGCGATISEIMGCVDEAHLKGDVTFIAAPRLPKSPHWQEVQDLCAERFAQYGFEVELHNYATGVNVIGKRIGATQPDEQVIVSAHYDHIANCSGADDNATGVAAVLETARVLEGATLSRTLILACWDEEEAGLLGSLAYAARAKANGDKIVAISAFDMIGFKNDAPNSQKIPSGFDVLFPQQYAAVAANDFRADFVSLVALDSAAPLADAFVARTKQVGPASSLITLTPDMAGSPQLSDLSRSDHAAFWLNGFPALLVTDSSNFRYPQYHCRNGDDVPSLLNFGFLTGITRASVGAHLDIIGLNQ